ncbi:hypothetical protein [Stenotrophomonas sp. CC22-02]|uniref:hypothetical protein n=1 Tax=Stenotrophomonas sp. CC22-02 TaxID=1378087 RepID=UPI0010645A6C|nr:hypothetical protein [Stenotrophomonas sp. CC22-02]
MIDANTLVHMSSNFNDPQISPPDPGELAGDPARQAVASIRGIVYQIWWSIDAWLRLGSADEVIFLEGAEDLDRIASGGAIAGQVKHEVEKISLNNQRSHEALENYWTLSQRETTRRVDLHYITTASAAVERDAQFDGVAGMEAWRIAQTNTDMASRIQAYLLPKLSSTSALRRFLNTATTEQVKDQLISRVHWFLEQPGLNQVKQSVEDRLVVRLNDAHISLSYVESVRDRLHSFACDVLVRPESTSRRLTLADLLREIERATTEHVPVPALQFKQFLTALRAGAFDPASALLKVMLQPVPQAPAALLTRASLVDQVRLKVSQRKTVLLTGTIHKGKTTLAQVIASALCPEAWWFLVESRSGVDTDNLLRAIAASIGDESSPSLVVIDNIDLSPATYAVYGQTLALLLGRAARAGRGVLLTARGESVELAQLSDLAGIEVVDVPEMSVEEVEHHCLNNGCPESVSQTWAAFICGTTGGHPKLVQVRVIELTAKRWPPPTPADVTASSPAITSAKQIARRMFSGSVTAETAAFVYTAAEATFPLTRSMLLSLANAVGGISNGGDVIDALHGKWLEQTLPGRLSVTPLLKGAAAEAWSTEHRQLAHRRLYDAIARVGSLHVSDAAALLFHAYLAHDASRLAHCARVLETIGEEAISAAVFQHLRWLPYVALSEGQKFFETQAFVSVMLRQLQFSVASQIDAETVPTILARWSDEVESIREPEPRSALEVMRCLKLLVSRNPRVPLRSKLAAIGTLSGLRGESADVAEQFGRKFIASSFDSSDGIPGSATSIELYLALQASSVRDFETLAHVLDWLDLDSSADQRQAFEAVLSWPLVNSCGAFVHGAWASLSTSDAAWESTCVMLSRAAEVARHFNLAQFGSEVARAMSIIRGEYLHDHAGALRVLADAASSFGETVTIREQRVNALFQANDDTNALAAWEQVVSDPEAVVRLDAFAYRRAGICACRLERWVQAELYFVSGSDVRADYRLEITRHGLLVDASHVAAMGGEPRRAARMLTDLLPELPEQAYEDGREDWEALVRFTNGLCDLIYAIATHADISALRVPFGKASEPGLSFGPSQPNQRMRVELTIAKAGLLASQLGDVSPTYRTHLEVLRTSSFPLVRFCAAESLLAFEFNSGTGPGFALSLAAFEQAYNALPLSVHPQEAQSDDGAMPLARSRINAEGLFAVFAAAAICCEKPSQTIASWRDDALRIWGASSEIVSSLSDMSRGLALRRDAALGVVTRRVDRSIGETFGAALGLMGDPSLDPEGMFQIQRLAASATVCFPEGLLVQKAFGRPVARRLSMNWTRLAASCPLFEFPERVPSLVKTVSLIEDGEASIGALLAAAARTVGTALGELETRLE